MNLDTRRVLTILCAATFLVSAIACCGLLDPASRLYGKWKLDVDATIEKATGGNEVQAGLAKAAWGLFGGDVTVEFRRDGTATFRGNLNFGSGSEDGNWTLTSADGDTLKIQVDGDDSQPRDITIHMVDSDTFEVNNPQAGKPLVFRRVKD